MAKHEFPIPVIMSTPEIPPIQPGVMAHSRPFVAKAEHQEPLGFPGELVDNWKSVALDKMEELLGKYRAPIVVISQSLENSFQNWSAQPN